nr:MAG TPA: hypothetical protein [Caudoviricetes sp.]
MVLRQRGVSNHVDMIYKVILITSRRALRSFYEYDY